MKKQFCAVLTIVGGCLAAGSVFAQCTTFEPTTITAAGTFPGNTCTKNLGLTTFCAGGNSTNGLGSAIFNVTLGASNNFTITVVSTTANFTPEVSFIGAPCASTTGCIVDSAVAQGTATNGPSAAVTGQPAGGYFLIVNDVYAESPGCGNFNATFIGTLPVKLQNFSVQ